MKSLSDIDSLGGKAEGLLSLKKIGIPVPEFMIIPANDVLLLLNDANEMENIYQKIKNTFDQNELAIRSSANKEDGEVKSYAGFFSTVLNVKINRQEIYSAIKKVYDSAQRSAQADVNMNVIIQAMIKPVIAGVCFSEVIDEYNQKLCLISFVRGLANKLVDGKAKATNALYKIKSNKINYMNFSINGRLYQYTEQLHNLLPVIQKIRDKIYPNADIEWCVDKNGHPWIVQVRPITKKIYLSKETQECVVASDGLAHGKAYCIDSSLPTDKLKSAIFDFKKNDILVSEYTDTLFMPAINKADAILTVEGDILSHSAITSRELNIPCLVGIKNLLSKIKTGDDIYINTYKNILEVNGNNLWNKTSDIDWTSFYDFSNLIELKRKKNLLLFENTFGNYILYYESNIPTKTIETVAERLTEKYKNKIQLSNSNKYHWYFEWQNFNQFSIFRKYSERASELAQNFQYDKIHDFYEEVFNECLYIKNNKSLKNELRRQEIILSLYFLLDMLLPMGLSIRYAYLKSLPILPQNMSFSSLFTPKVIKNKTLSKIQRYLLSIAAEKNKIFAMFIDNNLLSYDYMQIRDQQIRSLFDNKYPKYSVQMYQLFYKRYMKEKNADCK